MNDLSREARALIEDARPAERPDASAKSRVRSALAAQLSMPPGDPPQGQASSGAPPAVSGAGVGVGLGTKLVLVCALTTAGALGGAGLRHWIAPPGTPGRADQSSPHPSAPAQLPSLPTAVAQPPAARVPPPVAEARIAAAPASMPSDRPRAPARGRLPNQDLANARQKSLQRNTQATPAEPLAPNPKDLRTDTPFSWNATEGARTSEPLAGLPSPAAPDEALRPSHVAHDESERLRVLSPGGKSGCSAKQELRLLAAAQIALREGRAKLALATLEQHTALCPSGRFREEHSTAHILALCLLHQREQALAEATLLATLAPASPQLARLRTSCAAAGIEKAMREKTTP